MQIIDFFDFSSALVSTTVQAHPEGFPRLSTPGKISDEIRLITGDYGSISFPVTFKQAYGKEFRDTLDTGWAGLYLMSDKMKSLLQENKLTGWKSFSIRLLDKKENELQGYSGLSITGKCGPIDISKSEVFKKRLVPNGPRCTFYKGLYVGLDEWDGSDFFLPRHNYGTITTTKAAGVIKSNKLTNIRLTNLAEIEIGEGTADLIRSKYLL